jgi:iron complex transport system substrate-binding protein
VDGTAQVHLRMLWVLHMARLTRRMFLTALCAGAFAPASDAQVLNALAEIAARLPRRIVALDGFFAEMLASIGVPPVGMTMRSVGTPPPHLAPALGNVASVGLHSAPDYEAVIGLRPDLILGQAARFASEAELLGSIAPTLLMNEPSGDWRDFMMALAGGVGRRAEAEHVIAQYDRRAADLRADLSDLGHRSTVLLLRVRQKDIRIYGGERRAGQVIYRDLGLEPHRLTPLDGRSVTVSSEIIPQLDADILLLMAEDAARMSAIEGTALWRRLPAVRSGHVYRVNMAWWNESQGPISFGRILDDIAVVLGRPA